MLFPQLLLAFLATTTFAAPASRDQTPFQAKSPDTITRARPKHDVFRTLFVVKGPPPPRGSEPYSASTGKQAGGKSYFKTKWTRPGDKKKETGPTSCFCAGGSICCHAADGLSCNYGVCGI